VPWSIDNYLIRTTLRLEPTLVPHTAIANKISNLTIQLLRWLTATDRSELPDLEKTAYAPDPDILVHFVRSIRVSGPERP